MFVDAAPESFAVPPLLPAPQQLATGLSEPVEGADHDEVADRTRTDRSAAEPAQVIIESSVRSAAIALADNRFAALLAEIADVVEPDTHGEAGFETFRQAADV